MNGKIAFVRGKGTLYTMRRDGSHERAIVRDASAPDYSANGRRILFSHGSESEPYGLYTSRADGTKRRRIPHTRYAFAGSFAPSGRRVAVGVWRRPYETADINTMRIDGSHRRRVVDGDVDGTAVYGAPDFSPNGRWIAFSTCSSIVLISSNGTGQRNLTNHPTRPGCDSAPDFSPDGRRIVFHRETGRGGSPNDLAGIYTIRRDGAHLMRLYEASAESSGDPVFSPDGRKIAFYRRPFTSQYPHIYTIRLDGSRLKRLSHGKARHWQPSWGVRR